MILTGFFWTAEISVAQTSATRVSDALQNITVLARDGQVGYATFWDGNKFVQCHLLATGDARCDAAGIILQPSLKAVLTLQRLKTLEALGWALNADFGNYTQDFPAGMPINELADTVLQTLTEGYGADVARLEINTAWIANVPCPPRAGYSQNLAGSVNNAVSMRNVVIRTCSYVPKTQSEPKIAGSAADLLAIYGPSVTAELQRLRVNSKRRVWMILDAGIGYIQCAPETSPAGFYCEAQSEQSWPALAVVLTPPRVAQLKAVGYADPGRAPNYWKIYSADAFKDAAIASELMTILHDVYGYTGASPLKVTTEKGVVSK